MDEEISVYGIAENSQYVKIEGLKEGEVYLSDSFGEKYGVSVGGYRYIGGEI